MEVQYFMSEMDHCGLINIKTTVQIIPLNAKHLKDRHPNFFK